MKKNKETGSKGEDLATDFLISKGYEILERNWRFKRAEIDIIARHNGKLIFIEVKARSYSYYGEPESFVDNKKKRLIADAASQYMKKINYDWAIRFDIIGVLMEKDKKPIISHFEDAFFK